MDMKIGIIGLGLIGGSLGRAIKKKTRHTVFACDNDSAAMLKGALLNAYDEELTAENATELDVLISAVYPSAFESAVAVFLPLLKSGAIVLDSGGNKRGAVAIMRKMSEKRDDLHFFGAHPMAGREFSGVAHSTPGLFENSTVLLVPLGAPIEALSSVKRLFLDFGCEGAVITTAEEHDRIISYTSQLAHIVSGAYIKNDIAAEHYGFSAGSFRDMTRVARLNPDMWTELLLENRGNLIENLDIFAARINEYRNALAEGDAGELKRLLTEGSDMKVRVESNRRQKLSARIEGKREE
ncbi:MAG: prephenate dehydrogenase/arogenate dehydrogenase family protein [Clostridiales bacterium]|jgi:prephenate dehydrogenase|nr:prephenate dehydrogenase/arogenate dehydrogenase family protein [Clostridiales bacterium]